VRNRCLMPRRLARDGRTGGGRVSIPALLLRRSSLAVQGCRSQPRPGCRNWILAIYRIKERRACSARPIRGPQVCGIGAALVAWGCCGADPWCGLEGPICRGSARITPESWRLIGEGQPDWAFADRAPLFCDSDYVPGAGCRVCSIPTYLAARAALFCGGGAAGRGPRWCAGIRIHTLRWADGDTFRAPANTHILDRGQLWQCVIHDLRRSRMHSARGWMAGILLNNELTGISPFVAMTAGVPDGIAAPNRRQAPDPRWRPDCKRGRIT